MFNRDFDIIRNLNRETNTPVANYRGKRTAAAMGVYGAILRIVSDIPEGAFSRIL
jgi:hypothetical protein